jgi:hypothetical protein
MKLEEILEGIEELKEVEEARTVHKKAASKKIRLMFEKDASVREKFIKAGRKGLDIRWGKK